MTKLLLSYGVVQSNTEDIWPIARLVSGIDVGASLWQLDLYYSMAIQYSQINCNIV